VLFTFATERTDTSLGEAPSKALKKASAFRFILTSTPAPSAVSTASTTALLVVFASKLPRDTRLATSTMTLLFVAPSVSSLAPARAPASAALCREDFNRPAKL
jgi:hypothetical protein